MPSPGTRAVARVFDHGTVACHREVPPLIVSHAAPTKTEMVQNIGILYSCGPVNACETGIRRFLISIDEIAIEKRLRWNPRNNMIVGVCHEHSDECSLHFQTIEEANYLKEKLIDGSVHLACEVWTSYIYIAISSIYVSHLRLPLSLFVNLPTIQDSILQNHLSFRVLANRNIIWHRRS